MVSILIPTYNTNIVELVTQIHAQCIDYGITSEIVVLDDASTNTDIVKANEKIASLDKCRIVKNEVNKGRTQSRHLLANKASFDWLLFLDADVLPKHHDFINRFDWPSLESEKIVFGGISYREERPAPTEILRWKYGKDREAKGVLARQKAPHFIISQNLLIRREVFFAVNKETHSKYGLDNIVSFEIFQQGYRVKHIDNPVVHLGLENSDTFIKKSIESIKTTLFFEEKENFPKDFRPLQRIYLRLKKAGMVHSFMKGTNRLLPKIEKNLMSANPNLKLFDLYRLYHYVQLKNETNA